jgi:hypothetical protein
MENLDGQVIMLILFVVISGIKWFIEQAKKRKEPHEPTESLEEIYDDFRDEIRRRQTDVQLPEHLFSSEPAHTPAPPPLPTATEYRPDPLPPQRKITKPKLTAQEKEALVRLQKQSTAQPTRVVQRRRHASLRQLLGSPQTARQAVVLHEILDKPRSMQGAE